MKSKLKKQPKLSKAWSAKKTAIIAAIVLFSLLIPQLTHALITATGVAKKIIQWLTYVILSFFAKFVELAATFFENMLDIGFASHKGIAEIGWRVTRDFSNMFFILFLVVIAFATILRFEQYGIRKLLPKVIGIALLINFSLVICYVIIDFSDITARFFIDDAKKGAEALGGERGSISGVLANSLNLTSVLLPSNCKKAYEQKVQECNEEGKPEKKKSEKERQECLDNAEETRENCEMVMQDIERQGKDATFINMIISVIFGSIVLMVATFTLLVGGILLIIRLLFLWFLVMLVPFVFLCYIMPGLSENWKKWWKTFLSWCFFAPIYAFFIWLAIKISVEKRIASIADLAKGGKGSQMLATQFFSVPEHIIGFLFIIGILIGGLIAAKSFGIYGAETAMKIGQKMYKGAGRWTGARIRERAAKPMEKAAGWWAKQTRRIPLLRQLTKAPLKVMEAQRKGVEEREKKFKPRSSDNLKMLYKGANRTDKTAIAQILAERGDFSKEDKIFEEKQIKGATKLANRYGMAGSLLKNRPDLAPDIGKTHKEVFDKTRPADTEKFQVEAFENKPNVQRAFFESTNIRTAHLSKVATTNTEVMTELQKFITSLGADAAARRAAMLGINAKVVQYIDSNAGQDLGWTFG